MKTIADLKRVGFDIHAVNHAMAILTKDFPKPLGELCSALLDIRIADLELVKSGGGESPITQRLRRALTELNWPKRRVVIRKTVDNIERHSITHEIDHMRTNENGVIALEIEWNNKDPFFDRDLDNFHRLHSEGAISVGVIVTRGSSLQENLIQIISACAVRHEVAEIKDLEMNYGLVPTPRQQKKMRQKDGDFG